jgi:hypothetical protein
MLDLPASNLITRQTLGWEPAQPSLLADLDNGHYFPAADELTAGSRDATSPADSNVAMP